MLRVWSKESTSVEPQQVKPSNSIITIQLHHTYHFIVNLCLNFFFQSLTLFCVVPFHPKMISTSFRMIKPQCICVHDNCRNKRDIASHPQSLIKLSYGLNQRSVPSQYIFLKLTLRFGGFVGLLICGWTWVRTGMQFDVGATNGSGYHTICERGFVKEWGLQAWT